MAVTRYKRIRQNGQIINLSSETQLSLGIEDEHETRHWEKTKREEELCEKNEKSLTEESQRNRKTDLRMNADDIDHEATIMRALRNREADRYGF